MRNGLCFARSANEPLLFGITLNVSLDCWRVCNCFKIFQRDRHVRLCNLSHCCPLVMISAFRLPILCSLAVAALCSHSQTDPNEWLLFIIVSLSPWLSLVLQWINFYHKNRLNGQNRVQRSKYETHWLCAMWQIKMLHARRWRLFFRFADCLERFAYFVWFVAVCVFFFCFVALNDDARNFMVWIFSFCTWSV